VIERGSGERGVMLEDFGGGRLLLTDMRVAWLLLNEARYRAIERLFGLPRDQANLATLIALLVLAQAVHEKAAPVLRAPPAPSAADAALGAAALRELFYDVAGPSSRETPLFATLVTIAVLGGLARPVVRASVHAIRGSSHASVARFRHRYGYVVDPGQWRARRAQRRAAAGQLPGLSGG